MDVTAEIPFYYDIYQQIHAVVKHRSHPQPNDDWYIIQMLMYVEDAAHLGLCLHYAKIYRRVEDMIGHWAAIMQLTKKQLGEIRKITAKAICKAPESGMMKWIAESVASKEFCRLKDVALFLSVSNHSVCLLYPNTIYRENMYKELFKNYPTEIVNQFLYSDLAFNWVDKEGNTVLHCVGNLFAEKSDIQTAQSLLSVKHLPLDSYLVDYLEGNVATLRSKTNNRYENVQFTSPAPSNYKDLCIICQMVGWNGTYYINGSGAWYNKAVHDAWNGHLLWDDVDKDEREDRMFTHFITPSGDKVSCYKDAYCNPNL